MAHANSTKFMLDEAAALGEPLPEPPQRLSDAAACYWETIVGAKRRSAWTDSDLLIACGLCRDLALVETLTEELDRDGPTLTNKEGRRYPHPAGTLLDSTQRRILATVRSLQIHALATQGKADHQAKKNETARGLKTTLDNVHDLIARPKA